MRTKNVVFGLLAVSVLFAGCVSANPDMNAETTPSVAENKAASFQGLKRKVAIARFSNETTYAKGVFYDKENDPLGKQAVDILSTKLAASNKFILLERQDIEAVSNETKYSGNEGIKTVGADYLIIGSITSYGRKDTGEQGFMSRTKRQTVEAGVSLRLVDVATGQIIYSEEAHGESETETSTVLGMGGKAGYDATLSDKAISAAISKLVENIINNCMDRPWKSYFLSYDADAILISGGKSQNIKAGDVFDVVKKGKSVKNPQTGMMMELPGTTVGQIKVSMTGGDDPNNQYSVVSFVSGSIDSKNLDAYVIHEVGK